MGIRNGLIGLAFVAAFNGIATIVSAATATATVDGTDNLYYTNWGSSNGSTYNIAGRGTAASAVGDGGTAINFAGLGSLSLTATGTVVDRGRYSTPADGNAAWISPGGIPSFTFNGLPVYSIIGVWSATSAFITAIGDSFFVGSSATLVAPLATAAYLFLADNDGIFSDNSGAYSVEVSYTEAATVVPLPASLPLLGSAIGFAFLTLRRRRKLLG